MTCAWAPDEEFLGDSWSSLTDDQKNRALLLATSSLLTLTYNRVGTCPITVRPCPEPTRCTCSLIQTNTACECKSRCEINLPGPVGYIETIKIDGVAVDPNTDDWRLDDGYILVWQGEGECPFPETQDLNLPDTEVGTYSITYSRSYPVGADGRIAVAALASEFGKAFLPRGKCALPRGVTNVARNGVSFTIQAGLFPGGLTDIDVVDQFILKWAPAGSPTKRPYVFDPRSVRRG